MNNEKLNEAKEKIVDATKNVKSELDSQWNEAQDEFNKRSSKLMHSAKKACSHTYEKTRDGLSKCHNDMEGYIQKNPLRSAGIAVAVGAIGALLLGKKSKKKKDE